jgi:tRNA-dihydrouridine synthase B|tara:strand:+ start:1998 stop:3002 length:1005 start_codon:yes stop_codon:yes gene_type:complete
MSFSIGPYRIDAPVLLAPMAGITDLPLRQVARNWGAALTYSEMLTSQTSLWTSSKSKTRLPQSEDPLPRPVQIAGYDAQMLADAASACEQLGAGMIDINMGCPAKKVCKRAAGSALLQDEALVEDILNTVVNAVSVPVTLKTRTGWSTETKNGLRIAKIAEQAGIQALTVHGRTRACKFSGQAEYDTIAEIVNSIDIPVIANGDINTAEDAKAVLNHTGAAAVMIGRGALGQPWIFQQIRDYLYAGIGSNSAFPAPEFSVQIETMTKHLMGIHQLYGEVQGVRIARKHMGWYIERMDSTGTQRKSFNNLQSSASQREFLQLLAIQEPTNRMMAA